jgi:uncharacterized protein YrrD
MDAPALAGEEDCMNAKALIGMTVFAIDAGKNLGSVERLLFSPEDMRVTAFVVTPRTSMMAEPEPQRLLPTDRIRAIGQDAITVESETELDITADGELPAGSVAFDEIEKEKVITESGENIGEVSSLDFDDSTFRLDFIEIGRGFLSGSSLVSVDQVISVGEDVIVVRDSALDTRDRREDERVAVIDEADETDEEAERRDTGIF